MAKSTIKKGALNSTEKIKIQELHLNGLAVEDIADSLNRGTTAVRNYVNQFIETISKEKENLEDKKEEEKKQRLSEEIQKARYLLVEKEKQITEKQFNERLSHIMSKRKHPKKADDIYSMVINYKPVIENMRGVTDNNSRSVIVNSEAASSVADSHKKRNTSSRMTRGSVFPTH